MRRCVPVKPWPDPDDSFTLGQFSLGFGRLSTTEETWHARLRLPDFQKSLILGWESETSYTVGGVVPGCDFGGVQAAWLHPQSGGLAWWHAAAPTPITHDKVELSINVMFLDSHQIAIEVVLLISRMAKVRSTVTFWLVNLPLAQSHPRLTSHLVLTLR